MWHRDGLVKVIQVDAKPFVVTSNATDALLYTEDMGPITFFDQDDKDCQTSYAMTQRHVNSSFESFGLILTLIDDFGHSLDSDQ